MAKGNTITLLHASDFHVKADEGDPLSRAHDIRQLFVFDSVQLAKDLGPPTALVLSGDIAFSGTSDQYDVAHSMFAKILEELNLREKRVLLVPGNHDVDRSKTVSLNARTLRDSLRAKTDELAERDFISKREELLKPLNAYLEFAMPYDCLIQGENGYWEINNDSNSTASKYLAADFPISIRGISTVHVSDRNDDQMEDPTNSKDDGSHMYIARGQLSCDPATKDCPFRILVGHHPPSWWRFTRDRKDLAIARYHLHLFGHEHQFGPEIAGQAVSVKAGAINPDDASKQQARYNWIVISRGDNGYAIRIWSRVFDSKGQKFIEDPSWPAGQGFIVSHALDTEVEVLSAVPQEALPNSSTDKSKLADKQDTVDMSGSNGDEKDDGREVKEPSMHDVRFALLSQNHAKYAIIFEKLGFVPDDAQKDTLGGLEFYENALDQLLVPEKIGELIAAMEEEGVSVD